ncbi:DUF1793-domain-containing protein [Hymenopellis radicata]|nr:DUF1793-domain-containing protein [Hymenopellis radicata]
MFCFAACCFLFLFSAALGDVVSSPFIPPSQPLAVRSPYLSTWLGQSSGGTALNDAWAQFWAGRITAWAGFVRVDDVPYSFMGDPAIEPTFTKATQLSVKTEFVMSAGAVDLTISFLSPVEPNDLSKHSFPFSYMALSAASSDGSSHSVSVYTDISGEWVSGDSALAINWTTSTEGAITHQIQLQEPAVFGEISDQTQYGSMYYATSSVDGLTYQTGPDVDVRAQFVTTGTLNNTQDTNYRAIQDNWPVFAFAHNLGDVKTATDPVVVAIGHVRDPVIQYIRAAGEMQERSLYFFSEFSSVSDAIPSFLSDYGDALNRASTLDSQVENDASAISADYAGLVALSIRQAFGATEITLPKSTDGTWNTSDILNMNTVDVIFPAWPLYLYTNPDIGRYLLDALFEYQATGQYPNAYSIHDMAMPVEESGNMLIMALSYAQKTGDTAQLTKYYDLLDQWTQFLITDALIPAHQLSTDDFAGTLENQTNLAIKGIIGIKAMSVIAETLGDDSRSNNYSSIASSYVEQWQDLAISSDKTHLTLNYGNDSSWGLTYNLFSDKLLNLSLFPEEIYTMQTKFYPTKANDFGVPLDSRATYTKSDWEIWTAAIMTDTATRDLFISAVKDAAASGKGSATLRDWYETTDGSPEGFKARPVVGGHCNNGSSLSSNASSGSPADASDTDDNASTILLPSMLTAFLIILTVLNLEL